MILRISFILLFLLFIPTWYIFHVYLRDKKTIWRILFWCPNVSLFLITVMLSIFRQFSFDKAWLTGLYLITVLCLCIPETLYALLLFIGRRFENKKIRLVSTVCSSLLALSSLVILLWGFLFGNQNVVTTQYNYASPSVPAAFDGYRIVQFSDMHIGTFRNDPVFINKVVDAINNQNPDLVVFTGDMVNFRSEEVLPHINALRLIHAHDGIVSILGNHDYMTYVKWPSVRSQQSDTKTLISLEESLGWNVLLNENTYIKKGNDSIFIAGVENHGRPPFPQRGNLKVAMQNIPADAFTILLSHDPTHWKDRVLPETNIPLTLSGHTHGMQFKLGSFSPASWFFDEWGGAYQKDEHTLFVSLGIGEVLLPYRFGAWPEINVITLHKQ